MSSARPARSASRALHPTTVHPWVRFEVSDLPLGHRRRRRRGEEHSLALHICQRNRDEVGHDLPRIIEEAADVGAKRGEVFVPSKWAGSHSNNHQVRQQEPERTEVSRQILDGDGRPAPRGPRRPTGPAGRPSRSPPGSRRRRPTLDAELGGLPDVRRVRRAGQAAARPAGADRGDAGGQRVLQVVRRRVLPRSDQLEQPREVDGSRPRRPAARTARRGPSRRSRVQAARGGQTRERARDRRLPGSLPRPDHRERRHRQRRALRSAGRVGNRHRGTGRLARARRPRAPSARGSRAPARRTGRAPLRARTRRSPTSSAAIRSARRPPCVGTPEVGQRARVRASRSRPRTARPPHRGPRSRAVSIPQRVTGG